VGRVVGDGGGRVQVTAARRRGLDPAALQQQLDDGASRDLGPDQLQELLLVEPSGALQAHGDGPVGGRSGALGEDAAMVVHLDRRGGERPEQSL
jgi:hypothetical protein